MLRILTTRGHAYTVKALASETAAPRLTVESYDTAFARRSLAGHPTIFTDIDRLSPFDRELAGTLHRAIRDAGVPVYNDPSRVKTRFALLRALHEAGINDFNAYRVEERIRPERYPVFLRRDAGHGVPIGGLLEDPEALDRNLEQALESGIPESALLWIEYCAEPLSPGLFRKCNVLRVGDRMVGLPGVYQADWLVKLGTLGIAPDSVYRAEREDLVNEPCPEAVRQAFEIAHIDYGRIDYGWVDGRVQVYEINTNPMFRYPSSHPNADRLEASRAAWERVVDAFREIGASSDTRVPRVHVRHRKLGGRLRRWSVRSRIVP